LILNIKLTDCPHLKNLLFRKKKQKAFSVPRPKIGDLNFLTPKKKLTRVFCSPLVFLINQKSLNSDLKIISFALRQFFLEKNQKLSKFPAYFIIQVRQETSLNRDVAWLRPNFNFSFFSRPRE